MFIYLYQAATCYFITSGYKHKSGVQKRKEKKERIYKIRKKTYEIDTVLAKKSSSSEQIKDSAGFGLQDKASTTAEVPQSEITSHSAEPLDLTQPDETKFDGPLAKVLRLIL